MSPSWHWEAIDERVSGSSGDLAKMFKHEDVRQPSLMAAGSPSPDATLMAREVIQNSWDAARELSNELGDDAPQFELAFKYESLVGASKSELVNQLDLNGLAARASAHGVKRTALGLSEATCLDAVADSSVGLRLLRIDETGTTGMYGPFKGDQSKLFLALVSVGMTEKESGAGGSYGFGKAGLIRGSAIRTVVAYTCFRERENDPRVTRRLLGMTYWGRHSVDGIGFTGFARFGNEISPGEIVPFVNEEADQVAADLGIATRSASNVDELGTSFLLVEPTCEPGDLDVAVCRNWWPAIEDDKFDVEIVTEDGESLVPQPMQSGVLVPFVKAYRMIAAKPPTSDDRRLVHLPSVEVAPGSQVLLGQLGLVSELNGWSYPSMAAAAGSNGDGDADDDTVVHHRSLVALVRGPRMVVEYLEAGQAPPFVRGTFVADNAVDDLLRQTEPKAHDRWQTSASTDDTPPEATTAAKAVDRRIRHEVNRFRKDLKLPTPDPGDIQLPELERLFREIMTGPGTGPEPPPSAPREIWIHFDDSQPEAAGPDSLSFAGSVTFGLTDLGRDRLKNKKSGLAAQVLVKYQYLEDGHRGGVVELASIKVNGKKAPERDKHGWMDVTIGAHETIEVAVTTQPYSADASCSLVAEARAAEVQP